jgi:hypothetical protein
MISKFCLDGLSCYSSFLILNGACSNGFTIIPFANKAKSTPSLLHFAFFLLIDSFSGSLSKLQSFFKLSMLQQFHRSLTRILEHLILSANSIPLIEISPLYNITIQICCYIYNHTLYNDTQSQSAQ